MRKYITTTDSEIIYLECLFVPDSKNDEFIFGHLEPYQLVRIVGNDRQEIRISRSIIFDLHLLCEQEISTAITKY